MKMPHKIDNNTPNLLLFGLVDNLDLEGELGLHEGELLIGPVGVLGPSLDLGLLLLRSLRRK